MELRIGYNSEPQRLFLEAGEYEVLFGGAAGSGKSYSIILDTLRYLDYKDYSAIIFRRTYPKLEALIQLSRKIYPAAGGIINEQRKIWVFPSGAYVRFGFMQYRDDWQNYMGHSYCGQYFDELTEFYPQQYEMLSIWNRSEALGINPYRRSTSNPGGIGHKFVKARFVDTCPPIKYGEPEYSELARMWWQPMRPAETFWYEKEGLKLSLKYIPARVFDNVDLLKNNPTYLAQLLALPEKTRKAYLEGNWSVFEGMFFSEFEREIHVLDRFTMSNEWNICGAIDYGEKTVLEVGCRDYEGNIVVFLEVYTQEQTPVERAELMAEALIRHNLNRIRIIYDTNMKIASPYYYGTDKSPLQMFREVFAQRMGDNAPILVEVTKRKQEDRNFRIVANECVKQYLHWQKDKQRRFIKRPKLYITQNCQRLIETLPELIHDPDSPEGLDFIHNKPEIEDDPYDSLKYLLLALRTPSPPPEEVEKPWWVDMYPELQNEEITNVYDPFNV